MIRRDLLRWRLTGAIFKVQLKALFGFTVMATPTFLRYLPARLKPLSSPAVWAPLTIFVLLSIFIWEYHKNPDWFNREPATSIAPQSDLTPEEQARLAEVDTLDVLLDGSNTSGNALTTGSLNPNGLLDGSEEGTVTEDSRQLSGRDNPFGSYAAEYQFPGAVSPTDGSGASGASGVPAFGNNSAGQSGNSPSFDFGSGLVSPTAPATNSALSEALGRQQAARSAADAASGAQQPTSGSASSGRRPAAADSASSAGGASGQTAVQPAQVPGTVSAPFIRTTPDMSPPVGTTGYQTPATSRLPIFNIAPQQPSRNPYSAPAAPAPSAAPQTGTLYTAPSSTQPPQNRR